MRSLKLLASAGILPYTHARLQAILAQLFHRTLHLGDTLEALADQDFICPPGQHNPVQSEPAYLQDAVTSYSAGKKPEDDFPRLGKVLAGIGDIEGLLYLGHTYLVSLQQPQTSLDVYDRALTLGPEDPDTWCGKSVVLVQLGQPTEALAAFEQALICYDATISNSASPPRTVSIRRPCGVVMSAHASPREAIFTKKCPCRK